MCVFPCVSLVYRRPHRGRPDWQRTSSRRRQGSPIRPQRRSPPSRGPRRYCSGPLVEQRDNNIQLFSLLPGAEHQTTATGTVFSNLGLRAVEEVGVKLAEGLKVEEESSPSQSNHQEINRCAGNNQQILFHQIRHSLSNLLAWKGALLDF